MGEISLPKSFHPNQLPLLPASAVFSFHPISSTACETLQMGRHPHKVTPPVHDQRSFDEIFKFPDAARPIVGHERV
jgi:hypothetical protein